MATQYSNKPIVTDGLVYALDFGNPKSYVSGSSVARSLNFVPYVSTLVTFSGAPIPTLTPNGIQFTNNFTVDTGNPFSVVSDSRAFTMMYTVRVAGNGLFTTKDNGNQSSLHSVLNTNLSVVGWRYYNANIFNQRQYSFTPSTINHHTWTYSSGSYTYYINGIPVTGSDSATGGGVSLTWNLYLSGRSAAPDQFWSGSLFNFYLYDRVLTADEIYSNYLITAQRIGLSTRPKPYTVDPDVYNFLTATNITDGIITSSLDTFVRGLKSASLWDKMIAIYPFVGTGSVGTNLTGSHRWNLKEATVLTSSFNGSWNGSTSGSTPSGSNTFISVPLSPTRPTLGSWTYPNYSSSNVHISILSYDTPVSRSYLMGTGMTEDLAASTLAGDYGTPAAAYSVRKVRTAYTGALMDVRRSIDNVTSSIGFVSNGDLDTGSLLDWVVPGRSTLPGAYSGLAAAYSLRRVSASYAGPAIDVRRDSDNITSSIGFNAAGNLDTGALLAFVTGSANTGSGFVAQWYDQSGNNRHATQTSTGSQPLIVSSGSLVTENGKPVIQFNPRTYVITGLNPNNMPLPHSLIMPVRLNNLSPNAFGNVSFYVGGDDNTNLGKYELTQANTTISSQYRVNSGFSSSAYTPPNTSSMYLHTGIFTTSSVTTFVNSQTSESVGPLAQDNYTNKLFIGGYSTTTNVFTFKTGEFLVYTGSLSDSRPLIENNINNYYNIYTGSNHGFVARWYDQSGNNRHATQTATGSQPLIVESGSVIFEGTKPSLGYDGSNDYLIFDEIALNAATGFLTLKRNASPSFQEPLQVGYPSQNYAAFAMAMNEDSNYGRLLTYARANSTAGGKTGLVGSLTDYKLFSATWNGSGFNGASFYKIYDNNTLQSLSNSSNIGIPISTQSLIGASYNNLGAVVGFFSGKMQEVVLYPTDQSSIIESIHYGINSYYNIYTQPSASFATSSFTISAASGSVSASLNNRLTSGISTSGPLGLITVSRTGSNSLTIARNGVTSSFAVPASGALSTGIYLGAVNNNGIAVGNSPVNISFASVGTGLTNTETNTFNRLVGRLQYDLQRFSLVTSSLTMNLDAGYKASYPGSGSTWFDLSGNNRTGSLISSATYTSVDDGAIVFNGANTTVRTQTSTFTSEMSIAVWYRPSNNITTAVNYPGLYVIGLNYAHLLGSAYSSTLRGKVTAFFRAGGTRYDLLSTTATTGSYFYMVATYQSSSFAKLYVNGVLESSVATPASNLNTITDAYYSVGGGTDVDVFTGSIASIQTYNRALTQAEILQNFNATRGRFGV
jgi:hypothetical protein